jgi:cysteine-rich repeat protein
VTRRRCSARAHERALRLPLALLGLALTGSLALPLRASATAVFVIDADGDGFDDRTPRASAPGNTELTLGEQRMAAVLHAANKWGDLLDSKVPIVVAVRFADLGCAADGAVLAHAGAAKLVRGVAGSEADPALWYPSALANRLAGVDLNPGEPDVIMELNSAVDGDCRALAGGWYYGFDGAHGSETDLVETVLHELAHGLGFSSSIDPESGVQMLPAGVDAFSAHIVDLRTGKSWASLSAAERVISAQQAKGLAWDGARTKRQAAGVMRSGIDREGRPLLFTRVPIDRGSAVSHFDPLARPDLLMEPFARRLPTHEVDLTLAVLEDIGWTSDCGNGRVDPGEECDDGSGNANRGGARCRIGCRRARCGDGVLDPGEQCDHGIANHDASDGCRSDCSVPDCDEAPYALAARCDGGMCEAPCTRATDRRSQDGELEESEPGELAMVRRESGCSVAHAGGFGQATWLLALLGLRRLRRSFKTAARADRRA